MLRHIVDFTILTFISVDLSSTEAVFSPSDIQRTATPLLTIPSLSELAHHNQGAMSTERQQQNQNCGPWQPQGTEYQISSTEQMVRAGKQEEGAWSHALPCCPAGSLAA